MTTFKYILRDMGRLLIHHWVLGLLTLITASVMLWILGLTTLFSFNIRTFLSQLESELVVQVFLKKGSEVERVAFDRCLPWPISRPSPPTSPWRGFR